MTSLLKLHFSAQHGRSSALPSRVLGAVKWDMLIHSLLEHFIFYLWSSFPVKVDTSIFNNHLFTSLRNYCVGHMLHFNTLNKQIYQWSLEIIRMSIRQWLRTTMEHWEISSRKWFSAHFHRRWWISISWWRMKRGSEMYGERRERPKRVISQCYTSEQGWHLKDLEMGEMMWKEILDLPDMPPSQSQNID